MPSLRAAVGFGVTLLIVQASLELFSVQMAVMSALLSLYCAIRLRNLAVSIYRGSGRDLFASSSSTRPKSHPECDVIALKIRNFATISASPFA